MAKGQKAVPIDEYIYNLLKQAVDEGRASNLADAIRRSISKYLDVPYKSKEELKAEQDLTRIQELGKKVTRYNSDEVDTEGLR